MSLEQERLLARIEELEKRLAQVEARPLRRAAWGTYALGSLLAGLLIAVLTGPSWVVANQDKKEVQDVICKRLTIVDNDGKTRVVLGFDAFGGNVKVLNSKDQNIVVLDNDKFGGTLRLFGNNEKRLLVAGGNKDGCQINVFDLEGNIRAYLGCDSVHEGYLALRNKQNRNVIYAGADDDGGLVRVYGHDGKQRAFLGVGPKQGDGLVMLTGADGKRRHWIGSDAGATSHTIYGNNGVLAHDIRGGNSGAYHSFFTKDGRNVVTTIGASNDTGEGILRLNTVTGKTHSYLGANRNGSGGLILLNSPNDAVNSRVVIGVDANGVGFGEGRDSDNVTRRSFK
ncbi:MAG: hypothetical protein HYX68_19845 [Planctomycetes bacterium]|nr:hypothetical protein [Planctomycetota bacterium]